MKNSAGTTAMVLVALYCTHPDRRLQRRVCEEGWKRKTHALKLSQRRALADWLKQEPSRPEVFSSATINVSGRAFAEWSFTKRWENKPPQVLSYEKMSLSSCYLVTLSLSWQTRSGAKWSWHLTEALVESSWNQSQIPWLGFAAPRRHMTPPIVNTSKSSPIVCLMNPWRRLFFLSFFLVVSSSARKCCSVDCMTTHCVSKINTNWRLPWNFVLEKNILIV